MSFSLVLISYTSIETFSSTNFRTLLHSSASVISKSKDFFLLLCPRTLTTIVMAVLGIFLMLSTSSSMPTLALYVNEPSFLPSARTSILYVGTLIPIEYRVF